MISQLARASVAHGANTPTPLDLGWPKQEWGSILLI
jgi:hypothetical protein